MQQDDSRFAEGAGCNYTASPIQIEFEGFDGRKVVAAFDGGAITSVASALLLRHTDKASVFFNRIAACCVDSQNPALTVHSVLTLVAERISAKTPEF